MTVKELISKLERMPPDATVYMQTYRCLEGEKEPLETVEALTDEEQEKDLLDWPGVVLH